MASTNPSKNPFLDGGNQSFSPPDSSSVTPEQTPSRVPGISPSSTPLGSVNLGTTPLSSDDAGTIAPQTLAPASNRRRIWWGIILFLLIGLIGAGVFFWFRGGTPLSEPDVEIPVVTPPAAQPAEPSSPAKNNNTEEATSPYASENFKAGEIVIGGEAEFFLSEDDIAPLSISGIRGEAFTEKNKQEVKLVMTWKTNRLSLATIEYSKGIGQSGKFVSENDYSFNHSVIITGLDPATTYLYTIKAEDRFGNVSESEPHAVFTGARTVSLFDLIAGAIGDVFGWAVDK